MNLQRIRKAISDPKIKVISFDVFDTMVLRPFWKPSDLFMLLNREADRLIEASDVCNFYTLRIDAESEARGVARIRHKEDITLQDIYACLEEKELIPAETLRCLMAKEIELEKRYCTARKSARELVEYAIAQGKTIVAISDMYLPSSTVADILKSCGYPELCQIFVSGELGMTKRSGQLFRYAMKNLGVQPNEMLHIGDNKVSDVAIPKRLGLCAFHFPRTIDLLERENSLLHGRAFKEAYCQINSSFSGDNALSQLGIRCMLATAANLVYDDPFRRGRRDGGYADDPELFGTLALGMYCMAHALWIGSLTEEDTYDHVVFFARDGYLIRKGYEHMRRYVCGLPESFYAHISRKAMLPVQMTDRKALLSANYNISFSMHTPETIVKELAPVLKDDLEQIEREMGKAWNRTFDSGVSMQMFLKALLDHYMDEEKRRKTVEGFQKYFEPFSESRLLTYDVGYHMRQDILLKSTFPKMEITACFTHITDDLAADRGRKGRIKVRSLYPFSPYVSGYPRELFQSESAPSCEGYTPDGKPIFQKDYAENDLCIQMQQYAMRYMEAFTDIFKEQLLRLPMDYMLACLPFETFLHRPGRAANRWIRGLDYRDNFSWGVIRMDGFEAWRRMRLNYWCARNHVGKWGRYFATFILLCFTDRASLVRIMKERVLPRFVHALSRIHTPFGSARGSKDKSV